MSESGSEVLREALLDYEQAALAELGAVRVMEMVRLIEAVDRAVPAGGLFESNPLEIQRAVDEVLEQEADAENGSLLPRELERFLDVALSHGRVRRNPMSGEATIPVAAQREGAPSVGHVSQVASRLITNVLEGSVGAGLLVSPLALPISEIGEGDGVIDRSAGLLARRWRRTTNVLREPLYLLRVGLPVIALIMAVNSIVSCQGPFSGRTASALLTGAGVHQMKKMSLRMTAGFKDQEAIDSLAELSRRTGLPSQDAAAAFRLKKIKGRIIYLEHLETGELVIVYGEYAGSLRKGIWRMAR